MNSEEKMRQQFAHRLLLACDKKGLDEHGRGIILSKALDVTPTAVSKWLRGDAVPRAGKIVILARYLDVPVQWLHFGVGNIDSTEVSIEKPPMRELAENEIVASGYPLITWVAAGCWDEEQAAPLNHRLMYTIREVSSKSFWLKVTGDLMTAPSGISFPTNSYILIDPGVKPSADCFIIAKRLDSGEARFRRYIEDSGACYLRPLNPNWSTQFEEFEGNYSVIGVVVEARLNVDTQINVVSS